MAQDTQIKTSAKDEEMRAPSPRPSPIYVRTLLVAVIGMGVLIIVGLAVVVGTIAKRTFDPQPPSLTRDGFGTQSVKVPVNAKLVDIENGETQVILRLHDDKGALLIFIDPRKGIEKGRLRLQNEGQ